MSFGLVIDIDGVIIHHKKSVPGSAEALALLRKHAVPFVLLTNNTGPSEPERAHQLNAMLGEELVEGDQVILNYTPVKSLLAGLDGNVLMVGREEASIAARLSLSHKYVSCH